ncbi:proprotein convertase subtilisin/kexin type 9 [Scleropages formosus]|nr:proprotein convertase subtilisin/kexin type 9 [Scleropages formosus]
MRPLVCVLCLLLPCAVRSEDYTEDEQMIISLILQDDTRPEPGAEPSARFYRCTKDAWRIPGQYLVVLRDGSHEGHVQRTARRLRATAARRGYLIEVLQTFSGGLHGFLVRMSSDVLDMAMKLPHVEYIEEDSSIFAQAVPWNLDRIVLSKHTAGMYSPPNDGDQVGVYLLDTSVQSTHREIEGRVLITDFNSVPEEDGVRVHRQASKCDSHGTHTAGVVGGHGSGVARRASVHSVRVLNCQGKGTVSGALAGLEYVRASVLEQPYSQPPVVLLPFAGGFSHTLNKACRMMARGGAILVAAAGNYRDDACLYSPASEPQVITVGATDFADQPLSIGTTGTNFGRCVDLFAPGDDIVSASSDCATCFTAKSGTSQAAAHVAGIAAVILNSSPNLTSTEVLQRLLQYSVKHAINPSAFPEEHRLATPSMVAALPTSTSKGGGLLCRSEWSAKSGSSYSDTSAARCLPGEEMFSCSSFSPSGVRAGESISILEGQKECVAHNTFGGQGVYAIARCCTWSGARCQAHSGVQDGELAVCPSSDHRLTGCSSHSVSGDATDTIHPLRGHQKGCSGRAGVRSHALCCQAPDLECQVKEHSPSAFTEQVELSCEEGWTLTGCTALSRGSVTHGAYPRENTCLVKSSGGGKGTTVVAICCRSSQA